MTQTVINNGDSGLVVRNDLNVMFSELYTAVNPGFVVGRWYQPIIGVAVSAGAPLTNGSVKLIQFSIPQKITISDLGCRITTAVASGNLQLAIYANNAATQRPTGSVLAITASISTASTGTFSADITGADVQLSPGFYWMAVNVDATAGGTVVLQTVGTGVSYGSGLLGSTTLANISSSASAVALSLSTPLTFGTWSDLTSATFTESTGATNGLVFLKVSSVP